MAGEDASGRTALQERLLRPILWAARRAPYGKGRAADLLDWPVLERETIRGGFRRLVASRGFRVPASTSGASGVPLQLVRSLSSVAAEQAFHDSLLRPFGLSFRTCRVAVLRGEVFKDPDDPSPPFWRYRGSRYLVLSYPHLRRDRLHRYAEELRHFRPDVLWIYPTSGDLLAGLVADHGLSLRVPVILTSSESLLPGVRSRLESDFGAVVIDYHGQAERSSFSWQTKVGAAWFDPAYGVVELVPVREAVGTPPGERVAEVIGTGLWNTAMPLVRYRTGDYVSYPDHYSVDALARVALGLEPFTRWYGRSTEYLVTPEGARIQGLNNVAANAEHVLQVQFIQERLDGVEIRVRPGPGYTLEDGKRLVRETRRFLPASVTVTVVAHEPLRRTPSGKTPFMIRTVS